MNLHQLQIVTNVAKQAQTYRNEVYKQNPYHAKVVYLVFSV